MKTYFYLVILLMFSFNKSLFSQNSFVNPNGWNYQEGFKANQDVNANSQLKINSFFGFSVGDSQPADEEYFKISFKVPKIAVNKAVEIKIEDKLGNNYYMYPEKKILKNTDEINFRWKKRNEIVGKGIKNKDLKGLVLVRDIDEDNIILPIFHKDSFLERDLNTNKSSGKIYRYEIRLIASTDATVRLKIFNEGYDEVFSDILERFPKNTEMVFDWFPKDLPPGKYYLYLKYTFFSKPVIDNNEIFEFVHN